MGASHDHTNQQSTSNLRVAFFLNLAFTVIELVGGIWTNSLAILSDALHDLGDSFSLGLSWYLENYSKRGKDSSYRYGYRRFSLLAALINSIVIIAGSAIILTEAIPRLMHPQHSNAQGMFVFAIIGVLVNGAAVLRLRGGSSMNEKVITWHLLEDVMGWGAVLVVSVVLMVRDIHWLDPLLSIAITGYILWNVGKNLKETLKIFLQRVPRSIDVEEIEQKVASIENVLSVHDTRVWSLDGESHVLSSHVVIREESTHEQVESIKNHIRHLTRHYNILHTTIEIEYEGERCALREPDGSPASPPKADH